MQESLFYNWQTLVGSIMGASASFILWMISEYRKSKSQRKERLIFLNKLIAINLLTVADTYRTINKFLDDKLKKLVTKAEEYKDSDEYFVGTIFIPLFLVEPIEISSSNLNTGSSYVDSKIIQVIKTSRDFSSNIEDARRQFSTTLEHHRELALMKRVPAQKLNQQFKRDLENYSKFTREEILENNIPIYIEQLTLAQVSLNEYAQKGFYRWHNMFKPNFKYFKSMKQMRIHEKNVHERIDSHLKTKFETRHKEILSAFSPQLKEVPDEQNI